MKKIRCHKCNKIFYVGLDEDLICPHCGYDNGKFATLEIFGMVKKKTPEERAAYIFKGNEDVIKGKKMPRLW